VQFWRKAADLLGFPGVEHFTCRQIPIPQTEARTIGSEFKPMQEIDAVSSVPAHIDVIHDVVLRSPPVDDASSLISPELNRSAPVVLIMLAHVVRSSALADDVMSHRLHRVLSREEVRVPQ